jgi:hypothetical protein
MAETSNVKFIYIPDNGYDLEHFTIASATVLAPGDLTEITSGAAVAVNAASDVDTFGGLCLDYSANGQTTQVQVALKGVCQITCASDGYGIGQGLKYSAGANGTDWVVTGATTGEDAIMKSRTYSASDVTTLEADWDAHVVGIATPGAGLFEASADEA